MMISFCSLVLSTSGSATMATFSEAITLNGHMAPTERAPAAIVDPHSLDMGKPRRPSRSTWDFTRAIAVNQKWVPSCIMTAKVVDPHDLSWSMEGADVGFTLVVDIVHFGQRSYPSWLAGPRGLIEAPSTKWWRDNANKLPVFQEIKRMITSGWQSTAPTEPELVLVHVRDKTILVANTPRIVSLALTGHPGAEPGSFEDATGILGWFLTQVEKDVKALQKTQVHAKAEAKRSRDGHGDGAALAIKEGLKVLNVTPNVRRATWLPSSKSFRIRKWNETIKCFRATTFKKRKANAPDDDFRLSQAVCSAAAHALRWAERGD